MKLPPDTCPVYNHIDLRRHLPDLRASLSPSQSLCLSKSPLLPVSESPPAAAPDTKNGDEFTDGAKIIFALFLVFFFGVIACYHLASAQ